MYTVQLSDEFASWLDKLRDKRAKLRIVARLRQAGTGNLGDWKPLGGQLSEMRVDVGPGYRLYFTRMGTMIIVVLNGGDKATQQRDINRARRILNELEAMR